MSNLIVVKVGDDDVHDVYRQLNELGWKFRIFFNETDEGTKFFYLRDDGRGNRSLTRSNDDVFDRVHKADYTGVTPISISELRVTLRNKELEKFKTIAL